MAIFAGFGARPVRLNVRIRSHLDGYTEQLILLGQRTQRNPHHEREHSRRISAA
jgi:hypothetical protein